MADEWDFSGWATRNDLVCSDGRTIRRDAFSGDDGIVVPLLWSHGHKDPESVLGHALLENRPEGVYAYAKFNETPRGLLAKQLVHNKDVNALSIFAKDLIQRGKDVLKGKIKELSIVLAGANPGAYIDNLLIQHSDDDYEMDLTEAIIWTGMPIIEHADQGETMADKSVQEIFDSFTEEQQAVVKYMLDEAMNLAVQDAAQHSDELEDDDTEDTDTDTDIDDADTDDAEEDSSEEDSDEDTIQHGDNQEGKNVRNIFAQKGQNNTLQHDGMERPQVTLEQMKTIIEDAKISGSFKTSFLMHADEYGITNMSDVLFPDAKVDSNEPQLITRRMEWVTKVIDGCVHSPFSRVKCVVADITAEEARARGYVKTTKKKEMLLKLLKRVTTPKTFYIKAKLDRDDIVDITDLDVVAWMKKQMRLLFLEELARAILISDGRAIDHEDKIDEEHIRPIAKENALFAHQVIYDAAASAALGDTFVDAMLRARINYKGSGGVTFFTTNAQHVAMLLLKDDNKRRLYNSDAELCAALNCVDIVEVEPMEQVTGLLGIFVNLTDYTIGADKGGETNFFDDFDIDYNQLKYLYESRLSGALTKPKSALVVWSVGNAPVVESIDDMLPPPVEVTLP